MPFYEYEITLENLENLLKEKNEAEKRQAGDQQQGAPNMNSFGRQMNKFQAPKMPSFKMPH
jgi:hypothetical protein